MRSVWRYTLIAVGSFALVMGIVGVFLPLWPTTPFLLLAAACYVRSSQRLYRWLLGHRHLGVYVRDFVSGRGIPRKAKVVSLALMWATTLMSSAIVVARFGAVPWTVSYALGLGVVAVAVHYYIGYHLPTCTTRESCDVGVEARARS